MGNGAINYGAVSRDFEESALFPSYNSGRATAPTTHFSGGFEIRRPLSASGDDGGAFGAGIDSGRLGENLVRSRSAQPSMHETTPVRPPPGLAGGGRLGTSASHGNLFGSPQSSSTMGRPSTLGLGIQRPASTGLLGNHKASALRPSAKTLMDLIQEDFPDDRLIRHEYLDSEASSRQQRINRESQEYGLSSPQYDDLPEYRSSQQQSYNTPDSGYDRSQSDYQIHQQQQQQQQHQGLTNDLYGRQQHQQRPQMRQMDMQQHPSFQQQQRFVGDMQRRQMSPDDNRQMYGNVMQSPMGLQQQQQQIYYNAPQQQRVDSGLPMHHHQVVQSGQTLYVNAPSPQGNYGYATIQYQTSPNGQPQIIHQTVPGGMPGRNDQYVSVVPMHGGGQQIAYWSTDQQSGLGPVTIVNPSGTVGGPITIGRMPGGDGHHLQGGGVYGNRVTRGPSGGEKGGRGRRNGHARRGDSKGGGHTIASPVLEEFRASKSRDWTMRQIEGYVLEFCQDQNGSRFIQQRLELSDPVEQQIVMKEVLPAIRRLRNDVFGNYVVQKLLDFGTPDMKREIRQTLEGEMLQLSLQMYGCRVVQKALEALDEEDLPRILMEFHHNVLSCIHDQNGNHVIQKCVEVLNTRAKKAEIAGDPDRAAFLREQVDFIINDVLVNTVTLSCHPYGCRVLQRILEHCDEPKKIIVLDEIKKCHQKLLDDQYGNYVIQHVLQFGRPTDRDSILDIIVRNGLLGLSRQKFASNVVEKLLKHGNGQQRRAVAREMLKVSPQINRQTQNSRRTR